MKLLLFGLSLMNIGFLGLSMLCAAALACPYTVNGSHHFIIKWEDYGLFPAAGILAVFGILGLLLSLIGIFSRSNA